jgi:phosphohistidine phosphatase
VPKPRRLILYRHAKSSWDDPDLDDFDRGLTERGTKAAPRMGRWFVSEGFVPDVVLCSDAVRAQGTLALTLDAMGDVARPKITFDRALYLASRKQIVESLRSVPADTETAMLVGHNPGLHSTALALANRGPEDDLKRLAMKFPTAAAAIFAFDCAWADLEAARCTLLRFQMPRALSD